MSILRVGGFLGIFPKVHPRLLPDGGAAFADDVRLDSGAVESIRTRRNTGIDFVASTGGDMRIFGGQPSMFRYQEDWFLISPNDCDFEWYEAGVDQYRRLIITSEAFAKPLITSQELLEQAGETPPATLIGDAVRNLDIPAPTTSLTASVTGTASDASDVPETRYYVTTFVDEWGAEGPPSPPSNQVEWREGQAVTLEGFPAAPEDDGRYNMQKLRLYRLNTTASGVSQYQYVAQLSYGATASGLVKTVTEEAPYGQVTTEQANTFSVGDEVCFTNFGTGQSSELTIPYRTAKLANQSAVFGNVVVANYGWPTTFNTFDLVFFYDFPNSTTADTHYGDKEFRVAPYRGPNGLISATTGLASEANSTVLLSDVREFTQIQQLGLSDAYNVRFVAITSASGHSVSVGDYIHLPSTLPGDWASFADYSFKVTNVATNLISFEVNASTFGVDAGATPTTEVGSWQYGTLESRASVTNASTSGSAANPGRMRRCIVDITQANPANVEFPNHGLTTGDTVVFDLGSEPGMGGLDATSQTVTVVDDDNFTVPVDTIAETAFSGGFGAGFSATVGMDELDDTCHTVVEVLGPKNFRISQDTSGYTPLSATGGLVTELAVEDYTDNVLTQDLAEVLSTINYDPPNVATQGIKSHPAGFFVGFYNNVVTFSEPGAPHAWPLEYRLSTAYPVVGLGVFANNVLVVTTGTPYIITGNSPAAMVMTELETEYAGVSKLGIVDMGYGICYPSHDGLILVTPNSYPLNVTQNLLTRKQWKAYNPGTFISFVWEGNYCAFYDDGTDQQTFMVNPLAPDEGIRYVGTYHGACLTKSVEKDLIYFVTSLEEDPDNDDIYEWANNTSSKSYVWESGELYTPKPVNMSVAKVYADAYDDVNIRIYADINDDGAFTQIFPVNPAAAYSVTSQTAFRLPGGHRSTKFKFRLSGTDRVSEVIMATTMEEMASVI